MRLQALLVLRTGLIAQYAYRRMQIMTCKKPRTGHFERGRHIVDRASAPLVATDFEGLLPAQHQINEVTTLAEWHCVEQCLTLRGM